MHGIYFNQYLTQRRKLYLSARERQQVKYYNGVKPKSPALGPTKGQLFLNLRISYILMVEAGGVESPSQAFRFFHLASQVFTHQLLSSSSSKIQSSVNRNQNEQQ